MKRPDERGGVRVDFAEIGLHAAEVDAGDFAGFCADDVRLFPPVDVRGDVANRGARSLDCLGIVEREWFAEALFQRAAVAVRALESQREMNAVSAPNCLMFS